MPDSQLTMSSATELADRLRRRDVAAVEVVSAALARIEDVQPALNCFTEVWADDALAAARRADDAVATGAPVGPLHGIPVAIKDTTPVAGRRTTLGSFTHEHWVPTDDAHVVAALRRAGAILVGHTTSPEFAHTLVTDSPLWGVTRNPWDTSRTPGGSSGGAGAAVAARCVPLAEGTDMGGSVRIPAAWCGVVGVKPSLGRIPMDSLPGLFDTISHHGPLARTVDDARLFLAVTQGPDDADVCSIPGPLDLSAPLRGDVTGTRIGVSIDLGCWAVEPAIAAAVRAAVDALADAGADVVEVDPAFTPADELAWWRLWAVFMAAYYGELLDEHRERMDPGVVGLIEYGRTLSAVDLKRIEVARTDLWRRLRRAIDDVDVLVCPTMAVGPWPAAAADRPTAPPPDDGRFHAPDMTAVFNLVPQCPVVSVPVGLDPDGLPIGMQIVGHRWREDVALEVARAVERFVAPVGPPHLGR